MSVYSQQATMQISMYERGKAEAIYTYLYQTNSEFVSRSQFVEAVTLIGFDPESADYWADEFKLT